MTEQRNATALLHQTSERALVTLQHREATTTSLIVADAFGKKHQHVMEAIRKVQCSEAFSRSNFRQSEYTDDRGKKQPMVEMSRDGFSFLAMGFNGKRAAQFKEQFLDAFNKMERALLNKNNLSWQQERVTGKIARRAQTDTIARFVKYATAQGSKSANMYYMQITSMTNQALFLVKATGPKSFRDTLDAMQLSFLTTAEHIIRQVLEDGMTVGLHYRDIYQLSRDKILAFAESLPRHRQISV